MQEEEIVAPSIPYNLGGDKASIIEKINPDDIIELLRNRLMGKMIDQRTGRWVTKKDLLVNAISELGAWEISNLLLSVSNANTSLSKLDDKTIRKRAYGITEAAVHLMISNWKEYKITNRAQIKFIAEIVYSLTFITLKMADAEGIRKMIMGMYQEHKTVNQSQEPKRRFFRRGR